MENTATAPTVATPKPGGKKWANLGLAIFVIYVIALLVLALDQQFHWGLFPPKLDRELTAKVQQLGDASLTPDKRDALQADIISWNTFSVPILLKAIEKDPPAISTPALQCLQSIAKQFYNTDLTTYGSDPAKLNDWWANQQAQWAKAESEKK